MPNGGEHFEDIGVCPYCGNHRIRIRQSVRPYRPWRCRDCNRVFRTPKIREIVFPPGAAPTGHILAERIPTLERRSRRLRRRLRIRKLKKVLAVSAVVLGVLAVVAIAAQQGVITPPFIPAPVEEPVERLESVAPSAAPLVIETRPPELVAAQVAAPAATPNQTASPTNTPPAKVIASEVVATHTSTAALVAVSTATAFPTPPPTRTPTPAPTATATATPAPTSTPTATPVPDKLLVLDAEATVEGYWSDGTANVGLELTLRNEGGLPVEASQSIVVSCALDDHVVEGCDGASEISLPNGFGPVGTNLTLRAPMGSMRVAIDYGGDAPHIVHLNVPERILGVDRHTWACYSDRSVSNNSEGFNGCYGWYEPTVEKWRSGSTVRVWATGNDNYIRAFRETLDEQLSQVLNLTFEWVENERDADYVAILGVSESDERPDRWANCPHAWGCGGPIDVRGGEVRKADLIVYHLESHDRFLDDYPSLKKVLNGVFIHEALHGLAPTGHAERSGVVLSVMRSAGYLTSIDKAILSLNSHPLIEPGMAISQVTPLIVFKDELLDPLPQNELTSYDLLERALATLQKVDTVRMKVKGGWSGGRCDSRFGKRQWATLEIAGFDAPDDPRLAHLQDDNDRFFIFYSDEAAAVHGDGWQHWQENRAGWNLISREELWDRTAWWVRNSKLHHTISELLWYYDEDDIEIVEQSDGRITLSAKYNPSETSPFGLKDEQLAFALVIDENSYEVERFEWVHRNHDSTYCHTYNEEGKDIEYGVKIDIPAAIVERSEYGLPRLWNQEN